MKSNTGLILCTTAFLCLGVAGVARASDQNTSQSGSTHQYGTQTERQSGTAENNMQGTMAGQPTRFNRASKLIGMTVKNQQGEDLGDIKDIVINLNSGKVSYAVLSSGGVLGVGEKLLAVPLTAFSESPDGTHLVLNATKSNISQAESIGNNWPSVQNPSFGALPFWQQNKSGVTKGTEKVTPPNH
jgi:sporulation protein YlmC with PRC-barrel domain